MLKNKFFKHEINEISIFLILGLIMTIILPIFIGFGLQGFAESFVEGRALQFGDFIVTYMVYYIMILAGLIGLPMLKIRGLYLSKKGEHIANQSNPKLFLASYLHNPESDGLLYNLFHWLGFKKNPMRWSHSFFRCLIIATIVFGTLGLIQSITQTAFIGIPQMPFQVTPFAEVIFSAEPPAFAETCMMLFVFSILMGIVAWVSSKLKLKKVGYFTMGIIVCLIIGFLWMGFHSIVYGNHDAHLMATFIFGFVGSLFTLFFGTFIFWYAWHFWNNVFVKLNQIFVGNEDFVFIIIISLAVLTILWVVGELILKRIRKKKLYHPEVPT